MSMGVNSNVEDINLRKEFKNTKTRVSERSKLCTLKLPGIKTIVAYH